MRNIVKKAAVCLLFVLLFSCPQLSFAQSTDTGQLALTNSTHTLILKNPSQNKLVQIKRGDQVRIWLGRENLKGTFTQFSKDTLGIYLKKYGIRYFHINDIKKIKALGSSGAVLIGDVFRFSGTVAYGFGAFALTVGVIGAIEGDFSALLIAFVPPLVAVGLAAKEIGKAIQGKTYLLHSKWVVQ